LQIADLLQAAHAVASIGSVELMPEPKAAKNMSIAAQLSLIDTSRSSPVYLEEEFLMPTTMGSNTFQAASPSVSGEPVLALLSLSANPQTVTVHCIQEYSGDRSKTHQLQLAPGQMILTGACQSGPGRINTLDEGWRQPVSESRGGNRNFSDYHRKTGRIRCLRVRASRWT